MRAQIREGKSGCLAQDAWRSLAATPGFSRAARRGAAPARVFRSGVPSQGSAARARVGPVRRRRGGRGAQVAPWRILGCGAPAAGAPFGSPRVPGLWRCGGPRGGVFRVSSARTLPHPRTWLHHNKGGRGRSERPGPMGSPAGPTCPLLRYIPQRRKEGVSLTAASS